MTAASLLSSPEIYPLMTTLWRTLAAFIASLLLAIVFALVGQINPLCKAVIKDLMSFVIRIPSIASISFFVLLCGTGALTIYLSVMTVVIPVACLGILGIYEKINPGMTTINRVYRVPFVRQAFYLYLPTLFGSFHAIFILSYSLTFKALIMAEFLGGLSGLGYGLMLRRETLDLNQLSAYILLIALAGLFSQSVLERCARWLTRHYAPI
ncbi:MAG: ABC transporter permease subunit [Desulfuromonadales bacterium]|nr:ABC transporter permease subunit [Desulfuromonadales bacterium]MBN2791851.1 ABC transporter permease subunit [Desulfuromonadales bacterium]